MKRVEYRVHYGELDGLDSIDFDVVHHTQWKKWIGFQDETERVIWIERFEECYDTVTGDPHTFESEFLWELEECQ